MTGPQSVLIALGSNIEPASNLRRAVKLIAVEMELCGVSRAWESPPVVGPEGPRHPGRRATGHVSIALADPEQPTSMFLNAAIEITCHVPPVELKHDLLRPLERRLGRIRSSDRNAPRTIDLDIALFGDMVLEDRDSGLEIPDPSILVHAHVALPLAEVAPLRRHPLDGRSLAEIAEKFRRTPWIRPVAGLLPSAVGPRRPAQEEENG